ncbi:MAG TPA: small multi-drug export protein [Lentibacillus sp.]|uniref:small multi-drug export protein n=1 Tax=Lentibacillus sp. TaxID=1925746 RepID=UPI002B4B7B65|nr:small multi-drug export protein [Lentibacillus sp.]HLR61359.1 small multi-drug export protein [Lentibacillus sp.]
MENVLLQCITIFFISMVPFLEVFLTVPTAIIVFNFPPLIALIVAILGNAISVLLFVFFGAEINNLFHSVYNKFRKGDRRHVEINPRIKRTFDRFGATGVCFLSSILFSSQVGAGAITTLGASRHKVFIWTTLGVSTLAVVMATLSVVAEGFISSLVKL